MGKEPIRVIHISAGLGSGGTHKALEVFTENADTEHFDISVIGVHSSGIRGEYLRSRGHDVTIPESPSELGRIINEKNPQIVHIHGGLSQNAVNEIKHANVPNVVMTDNFGWPNKSKVDSIVDRYYFISDMSRLRYFRLFSLPRKREVLTKYQRMYYPLSNSDLENNHTEYFREKYGIEPDVPVIGKIGRQDASKWSKISIKAFERVVEKKPETIILLVTPPDKVKQQLKNQNLEANCIYVDSIHPREVYKFYDSIDVMGHSSKIGESFGYVIAEALARGTPVVVNSTPMRDNAQIELIDHGETGYIANSSQSFGDAIIDLLEDDEKRKKFGKAAHGQAKKKFGPKKITQKLQQEYFRLTGHTDQTISDSVLQLDEFETEYQRRLRHSFGQPSLTHQLERIAWQFVSDALPSFRYHMYHLVRYNKLPK